MAAIQLKFIRLALVLLTCAWIMMAFFLWHIPLKAKIIGTQLLPRKLYWTLSGGTSMLLFYFNFAFVPCLGEF